MSKQIVLQKAVHMQRHYLPFDPATYITHAQAAKSVSTFNHARLRLVYKVIADWSDNEQTIFISLANSDIGSGGLFTDTEHYRGYFQDSVKVQMALNNDDMTLYSDGPQDVNGTASTTSSVSVSTSVSANVGFFDEAATGGAGMQSTFTKGSSCSASLMNFAVHNRTNEDTVLHEYRMATAADGTPYSHPIDLQIPPDKPGVGTFFKALINPINVLPDVKLRSVPNQAKDNMPLISQAVWKNQTGTPITDRVILTVKITQGLACLWSGIPDIATGFKHPDALSYKQETYSQDIVVDLGKIAALPTQSGHVL